ncbi:MAG: hypothetical protein JOZ14_14510 [Acidobacteria bacterium]|nr:hypothetical protein [Acidobacteriota bacterium]
MNHVPKEFSDSIVRHAFSNSRTSFKTSRKTKFIVGDQAEDLLLPDKKTVKKAKMQPESILKLIDAMPHPRDRALLAVVASAVPHRRRPRPDLESYAFGHFIVYDTAYEGRLYEGKVKLRIVEQE